jgi:hypothetical protein
MEYMENSINVHMQGWLYFESIWLKFGTAVASLTKSSRIEPQINLCDYLRCKTKSGFAAMCKSRLY